MDFEVINGEEMTEFVVQVSSQLSGNTLQISNKSHDITKRCGAS